MQVKAGRPRGEDSAGRSRELLRLVASGRPFPDAVREARVSSDRVVTLLTDSAYRAALVSLLDSQVAA